MSDAQQLTGLKKRQQIANANKMIFVWVIIASVVVSLCGVTMQFMVRQAIFNQEIIAAKIETQSTLAQNIENVPKLKEEINALYADANLAKVKANPDDTTLKVILDALPTTDDGTALGASLQQVILPISGVDTSDLVTVASGGMLAGAPAVEATDATVPMSDFSFAASGDYARIRAMLGDLERTIRPMNVQTISFQNNDGQVKATVVGVSYYSPQQTVKLGKEPLKP